MGFLTTRAAQLLLIVLFLVVYSMIAFRVAAPPPDCLSVRDFADQLRRHQLQLDAAGLLHRLADVPAAAEAPSPPLPARDRPPPPPDQRRKERFYVFILVTF